MQAAARAPDEPTPAPASATLSPNSLAFSTQQLGSGPQVQPLTLTNTGSLPLSIQSVTLDGDSSFTLNSNCSGRQLSAQQSCLSEVTFQGTSGGLKVGRLLLAHSGEGPHEVQLAGVVLVPSVAMPSQVSFSPTVVGGSDTQVVQVLNDGTAPHALGTAAVTGAPFRLVSSSCAGTLEVNATCELRVAFDPLAAGASEEGALTLQTLSGTRTVALQGTGLQAASSLSTSSLTFASQQVGTSSGAQRVTLTNVGTYAMDVSSIEVTGGASDFTVTHSCSTVAVGATCPVDVVFRPTAQGVRAGTVTLTFNGLPSRTISLTGSATPAGYRADQFSAAIGDYVQTLVNNTGVPLNVNLVELYVVDSNWYMGGYTEVRAGGVRLAGQTFDTNSTVGAFTWQPGTAFEVVTDYGYRPPSFIAKFYLSNGQTLTVEDSFVSADIRITPL